MVLKLPYGLDTLDAIQLVFVVLLSIIVANYLYMRWAMKGNRLAEMKLEGFENPDGPDGDTIVFGNDHLYDAFYAKVYDIVVDGSTRQNIGVEKKCMDRTISVEDIDPQNLLDKATADMDATGDISIAEPMISSEASQSSFKEINW